MSEETAHLLEAFEALPAMEKEAFAIEVLSRVHSLQAPPRSAAERVTALRDWAESHPHGSPLLSDEAISRATMYHERG